MAYDAGMLRFIVAEINEKLINGKVDKIYQPSREEAVFVVRCAGEEHRLDISAGGHGSRTSASPRKSTLSASLWEDSRTSS